MQEMILTQYIQNIDFDGSKTQEGSRAYCILVDLERNKHYLSSRLEFECTNNIAEALVQGLKKAIELNVKNSKKIGDSGQNPFQQQLRETHPKMEPLIQKELNKTGLSKFKIYKDREKVFL